MLNKRPFDDTVEADEKNPIEPVYCREYTAVPGQVKECRCVTEDIETFWLKSLDRKTSRSN